MSKNSERIRTRRNIFTELLRYTVLAVLGLFTVKIFTKKRGSPQNDSCINRGICPGCGAFDRCNLPQALSIKQGMKEQS